MASTPELDALKQKLAQTEVYTRKSDEELRQAAEDEFTSYYNQLKLSQQQAQQRQDLALANQAAGLQSIYDKQRNQVMETTAKNYTAAGNALLKRGMQRSSYGLQTLAGVNRQGAKDLQDVNDQQSAKEGEIASQRSQLEQQLAETLAQYDADMAKDIMNRLRQLQDQEYERETSNQQYRDQLAKDIYDREYALEQQRIEEEQFRIKLEEEQRQFNETLAYNKSKGSGGSGGSSKKATTAADTTGTTALPTDQQFDELVNGATNIWAGLTEYTSNPSNVKKTAAAVESANKYNPTASSTSTAKRTVLRKSK